MTCAKKHNTIYVIGGKSVVKFNIKALDEYLKAEKISKEEFCLRADLNPSELDLLYTNNLELRIDSLFKICKTLRIEIAQMFC